MRNTDNLGFKPFPIRTLTIGKMDWDYKIIVTGGRLGVEVRMAVLSL